MLSDILVKIELCIPLERGSSVLSTGEGFICLSPPSKLKFAVRFCSIYKKDNFVQCYSAIMIMSRDPIDRKINCRNRLPPLHKF